ncbi:unnamed protein product [Bathycoccus prasinos]
MITTTIKDRRTHRTMCANTNGQRRGQRTTSRTVFNVVNFVALAGFSFAALQSGGGATLVVSAARLAPSNVGVDLPAGRGKGGYEGEYEEEGLTSVIGVDDEALTILRRSRSLLTHKTHWHGQSFSVKDHVGDRINRWKGGSAAEQAGIAKRHARENPNGHVAFKESANPLHSTPQVSEKKTRPKMHRQNAIVGHEQVSGENDGTERKRKRRNAITEHATSDEDKDALEKLRKEHEEENDDDDDDDGDGPGGCCGKKKCPKCRGLCNCRLCLRKEDVVGKSSSSYSSKSNTNNATTTIASLFEDSENLALVSLEATLDISERKKRASYCLVAMEKAFARSAECDAWEIEREEKKKKEEEKQSNNRNSNTSSSPPSDEDEDEDNDGDDEKSDDVNDESERNNNKKKRKKSHFLSTTVPSGAFCDACANDIVAVCLSCDECDVRVCAYCISTLRKGTEAPYVERVCCLSHDDVARAKIKTEMSRRILSEKPPAAETKNATTTSSIAAAAAQKGSSKDSPLLRVNNPSPSAAQNQQREDTSKSTKNNDENDSALLPMKKRLKMAFKTLNSSFADGSDDELEKRSSPAQPTSAHHSQDHQQQRKQKEEEAAAASAAALKIAKKSKLEDDITCVACDGAMKVDLRMYDFKRVKEATHVAKKESSSFFSKVDKNGNDDESAEECPYCKMETIEDNVRVSSFGKGKETKIWTPDQKELLKAEKSALHANDAKQYNEFIAHFRYHWLRGDPVVVRNVETEMSWDPSVIERAMRDPNIASISSSSAAAGFGNLGGGGGVGVGGGIGGGDNDLNSSGAYAACFQHDAVVPVFACGADEYDELAKTKKTSTTPVKGGTSMTAKSSNDTSALQGKKEDAATTQLGNEKKKKKKLLPKAASTNTPKFSMALKDFFAGFFDPLLTFDGKLFQLRDFPRCIGGNRMNLKEVLPKHFRRLLAALPFRLYTNPEVGTINLFALQFQKYVLGGSGGGAGENFFQGVSSNSRSRGDVAAKKFVESLVKASFSYGNGTRTYVEGKSSIETFGVGSADDVCSVNVYSSTSFPSTDDKTIALWTVIRPQDADEVLRRVEEHEDIEEDALYLSDDALEKALLLPREDDKSKSKSIECFAFAQNEKECVLLPGGSLRQILNVRSNCRADVKFSSPEHCHGCNLLLFDDNINDDDFERRRVTVLKAAKACADVVLHPFAEEDGEEDEEGEENETRVTIKSDLEPDNISVLVAGGSGVAMDVFRQMTAAGTWVTVLQRHEDNRKEIESVGGFLVKGDVFDPKSVKKALNLVEEYDAVVSTVGGTPADPKADSEGNIALIDACVAKGIKKFVLVTSIGTGDSKSAPPQNVYDALEPVLIEKEKAEEHLKKIAKEKGIDFVIVRPGGLKSEPRTNTAVLTENTNVCGAIHREDVAALTMMCVLKDKANGKTLSAVDKAQLFDQPEFEVFNVGDGPLSPTQEATENALK